MTAHEQGERFPIAPLVADHQCFVGCVALDRRHRARAAADGRESRTCRTGGPELELTHHVLERPSAGFGLRPWRLIRELRPVPSCGKTQVKSKGYLIGRVVGRHGRSIGRGALRRTLTGLPRRKVRVHRTRSEDSLSVCLGRRKYADRELIQVERAGGVGSSSR